MAIQVGDQVRLRGYQTVGRVASEQREGSVRMLTVVWHVGGRHTAPEDGWVLERDARANEVRLAWAAVVGLSLLVVLAIVVVLSGG